ncbi:unnamed protein product [Linum tenue]|uniref:RNA helicase n=1 Tax=Linum tenue TaxID=586396 RepID=A0AAV0LWR3_9ROSI|nr:unnamed protein product [Linum tenue]
MPALTSTTRLLVLAGNSLPSQQLTLLPVTVSTWGHSVRFFSRVAKEHHGPLTLASVGFSNQLDAATDGVGKQSKFEKNVKLTRSPVDNPRSRVKPVVKGRTSVDDIELQATTDSDGKSRKAENYVKLTRSPVDKPKSKAKPVSKVRASVDDIELAPFSAKSFSELGLPPLLIERLESEGFKVPTDVQSAAIPTILKDHDVVIQSYTGSGKTLAYLLPILSRIGPLKDVNSSSHSKDNGGGKKRNDIEAVIVAPSRELGMQIVREVENILGPENKRAVQQLVGGANRSRQEEALKKNKPAIVVGTPGRIAEISAAGKLHTHGCRFLILDEVDELLSFNFREAMRRILDHVGRKSERRTVLVSATVPFAVIRAARSWSNDPVLVQAKKVTPLELVSPSGPVDSTQPASDSNPGPSESLPPSLKHYYSVVKLQHKVDALRRCVHAMDAKCVIAFMNHTKQLKDVVYKLEARGLNAAELHGDLGKLGRSTIMKRFKNGELRVLVTNELSARGLDVPECDLVVNLDLPTDSVHYAHRAGRTGRLGRKGVVVSICEESQVFVVRKMEKQLGVAIRSCEFTEGKFVTDGEEREESTMDDASGSEMVQQEACSP